MNTIGLASDHAGYELKEYIKTWLADLRIGILNGHQRNTG